MSQWLANVAYLADSARSQQGAGKTLRKNDSRAIYVLQPQANSGRMGLRLCKGKIAADGVIRSAAAITDMFGFQQKPPAWLRPEDRHASVLFAGLLSSIWGAATVDMARDGVAALL
ncbi:hypothetical protein V3391_17585, partial [Luteimonas sp. SMYT11W]